MAASITTPKSLDPVLMTSAELEFLTKRPHYDNLVIDSRELGRRVRFSDPQRRTTAKQPCAGLGQLDKMPLEIQFDLLAVTPISALLNLRGANSYAKQLIEQWEPFRTIMTQASDAVRALLATGAGNSWTTQQLVDLLFTTKCEFCGEHEYAKNTMQLSREDLLKLPQLCTLPQMSFWGFPTVPGCVFDYKAALDVVRQREQSQLREQRSQPSGPSMLGPIRRIPTGHQLKAEERSIQPRPKSSLQARRQQPALYLLGEELSPPETAFVQHACAVRLPAMTRRLARLADGSLQTEISSIEAVHCAGCAYYWNYHSPLTWQFHRLYPHQKDRVDTAFTRHLKHCVYARLQWSWIHNPLRPLEPADMLYRMSVAHRTMYPRNAPIPGPVENRLFEQIPFNVYMFLAATDIIGYATFQPQYTWPEPKSGDDDPSDDKERPSAAEQSLERLKERAILHPTDERDHYWDCLVSQDAVSQANWACANTTSAKVCLFGGPTAVVMEKHRRYERKLGRMPVLGFSEFYL